MNQPVDGPAVSATQTNEKTFFGHPIGLSTLFFTEMWERFSYYGMRGILILFMVATVEKGGLGFSTEKAAAIYGWYTSLCYALPIFGGWMADRFLGQQRTILYGGIIIAIGHFTMAVPSIETFYLGLGLIIFGTGFLKANISAIVGGLYSKEDERRDAGFTIFYIGINLGAFIAPFVCGTLGQSERFGWHWGFGAAGVGMTFGLIQYVAGLKRFGEVGLLPSGRKASLTALTTEAKITPDEWKKMAAIGAFFLFSILFWAAFEQAGSSLTLFAEKVTDNHVFGWAILSSWYQSLNSFFIFILGPIIAWYWIRLGNKNPSSPAKFAMGLVFVGLGFLVVAGGSYLVQGTAHKVSPMWLVVLYFLHTIGELLLSPVGLSTVTKLAPVRFAGLMMGIWFLSISFGNKLGGWVAGFFDSYPLPKLFGAVFLTTTACAVVLVLFIPTIKRLMGDVR